MRGVALPTRTGGKPLSPLSGEGPRRIAPTGWPWLALIVLLGLVLRLYEFRGFGVVDDAAYSQIAHQIADGSFRAGAYRGPAVFPLRLGILYPTALLFRWFGVSEVTLVLVPFVVSLLSIVLAYATTLHFFGRRAALIAAAVWALLPLDTFHASILEPDLVGAFFQSLGILGIVLIISSTALRWGSAGIAGLAIGLSFGVSWLCKESIAYAAPLCGFLLITSLRKDWRRHLPLWAGVAAGSLLVLGVEMAAYHRATGDWLFHLHETERNYHQYQNAFFVSGSSLTSPNQHSYAMAVVKRLLLEGPSTIFTHSQFLYLPLFAAIIGLHAMYWRDRAYLLPTLWFASLVFMFNFASSSLASYTPLVLFERYLYPVMLPAVVIVSGFLATLLFDAATPRDGTVRRERRFWGGLIIAGLLFTAANKNYANRKFAPGWADDSRALSRVLKPSDRVYTDVLTIHGLEFFWRYPKQMNVVNFEHMRADVTPGAGEYVVANTAYLTWLVNMAGWWPTEHATYTKPATLDQPPASWSVAWQSSNAKLYRVVR